MSEKQKLRSKTVICFVLVSIVLLNLTILYRSQVIHVTMCDTKACPTIQISNRRPFDSYIHVAFFAKYSFKKMKVLRGIGRMFRSILENTSSPVYLHVLLDLNSRQRTARTLKQVARDFRRRFNVTYYDIDDMAEQNRATLTTIRKLFFSKDVGRYADDIFFLSQSFHEAFPRRLRRLVFLDVDLKFQEDIQLLHDQFRLFQPHNVLGIAPDLQPQYRVDFRKYRLRHPGTKVGSPRPGYQGFNTGVVLFDLDRMRTSKLYNSMLNETVLEDLCRKYEFRGYLGHQDFFTLTGMEHPELYHELDCSWNRQLDVGWRKEVESEVFDRYHECKGKINVIHANGDSILD